MLLQVDMIKRLTQVCREDERLVAAMLYGSFGRGEGDRYSDLDVVLFFRAESLPQIEQIEWVRQIAAVDLYYHNEHGIGVAIFENLVRGEFHFYNESEMGRIQAWAGNAWFPSAEGAILVDKTGQLNEHIQPLIGPPHPHDTAQDAVFLVDSFCNWCLFGINVLQRGEAARAHEILTVVHRYVLRAARLVEGVPAQWVSPTKDLERELPSQAYRRYLSVTSSAEWTALRNAYGSAWLWGNELIAILAERYSIALPQELLKKISKHLQQVRSPQ